MISSITSVVASVMLNVTNTMMPACIMRMIRQIRASFYRTAHMIVVPVFRIMSMAVHSVMQMRTRQAAILYIAKRMVIMTIIC